MIFKFIGDLDGHGPDVIELFGYTFPKGEPVSVDDEFVIGKLSQNHHFETDETVIEGEKGLDAMTKDELEELGREYGIELDKRKSITTLIQQVQDAIDANED